jgi:hypothetical protein
MVKRVSLNVVLVGEAYHMAAARDNARPRMAVANGGADKYNKVSFDLCSVAGVNLNARRIVCRYGVSG